MKELFGVILLSVMSTFGSSFIQNDISNASVVIDNVKRELFGVDTGYIHNDEELCNLRLFGDNSNSYFYNVEDDYHYTRTIQEPYNYPYMHIKFDIFQARFVERYNYQDYIVDYAMSGFFGNIRGWVCDHYETYNPMSNLGFKITFYNNSAYSYAVYNDNDSLVDCWINYANSNGVFDFSKAYKVSTYIEGPHEVVNYFYIPPYSTSYIHYYDTGKGDPELLVMGEFFSYFKHEIQQLDYDYNIGQLYHEGYNDGYDEGYDNGYSTGGYLGYENGYADGVDVSNQANTLLRGVSTILGALLNAVFIFLNFEVFGISLASILSIMLGLVMLVWILKLIRG